MRIAEKVEASPSFFVLLWVHSYRRQRAEPPAPKASCNTALLPSPIELYERASVQTRMEWAVPAFASVRRAPTVEGG
jgi:hypothetical protein